MTNKAGALFKGTRAFSTLGCGSLSLVQAMELARDHEIRYLELRTLDGSIDLPGFFSRQYGSPAQLAMAVKTMPAKIVSVGTSLKLSRNDEQDRSAFLAYVPWAEACGASTLRAFDGGSTGGADEVRQAADTCSWWNALREENGWNVDLAVETHDAFAIESNLLRLLDALPECKVIWDSHHTWRKGGSHPVRTWERIRERVGLIHVKDSRVSRVAASGYAYVLPGDGEFPMAALFEALCGDGYAGVLSLEWERHWHPTLPTLQEALSTALSRAWW